MCSQRHCVSDCHPFAKPVLSMPTVSGSTELTTDFDKPVLSFVEGLRTNGWHIEGLRASACLVARNTLCTCGTPMGTKVLHAPVIASTRRVRGNPTVLVLKDFGIASVALLPRNDPGL
jgi:hypothetical protein